MPPSEQPVAALILLDGLVYHDGSGAADDEGGAGGEGGEGQQCGEGFGERCGHRAILVRAGLGRWCGDGSGCAGLQVLTP